MQEKRTSSVSFVPEKAVFLFMTMTLIFRKAPRSLFVLEVDDQRTKTYPPPSSACLVNILPGVGCSGMPRSATVRQNWCHLWSYSWSVRKPTLHTHVNEVHLFHFEQVIEASLDTVKNRIRKIKLSIKKNYIYHDRQKIPI